MKKFFVGLLVALGIHSSPWIIVLAIAILPLLSDEPQEKVESDVEEIWEDEDGNEISYEQFEALKQDIPLPEESIKPVKHDMENERQVMRLIAKEAKAQAKLAQTRSALRELKSRRN